MAKFDRSYLKKLRYSYQWALFALIVYSGYRFYLFTEHFISGGKLVKRPPLVEGFLPIGGLMSLKLWVTTGIFDPIHPASLAIFIAALLMSTTLKKSFCGWVCPVGTLSELLYKVGARVFGRNFRIHPYVDYPLRTIKYFLMAFFVFVVVFQMSNWMIAAFLTTPYWKIADVKMLRFFTDMSALTAYVLLALVLLSIPFKNFWCRYLCPYGALVGLLSYLSPLKVTRNEEACIHCHRCTKNCPALLPVERKKRVKSPECTGCLTCVSNCPSEGALDIALPGTKPIRPLLYVVLLSIVLFGTVGVAKLAGHWESAVAYEDYKTLIPNAYKYEHP